MKHRLLLVAIGCMLLVLIEPFIFKVAFLILYSLFLLFKYNDKYVVLLIFIMCFILIRTFHDSSVLKGNTAVVYEVRENYTVLKVDSQYVITYDLKDVYKEDRIVFEGEFLKLSNSYSFHGFSFVDYLKEKRIYYELDIESYTVKSAKITINNALHHRINQIENQITQSFLLGFFLNLDDTFTVHQFLKSSGMYFSLLIFLMHRILQIKLNEKLAMILIQIVTIFLGFYFQEIFVMTRIFFKNVFLKIEDKKDRLGALILVLLCIHPNSIYSLAFIFPIGLRMIQIFKYNHRKIDRIFFIAMIQSYYFYKVQIFSLLGFSFIRVLFFIGYVLCIIRLIIPIDYILNIWIVLLSELSLFLDHFTMYGKIPLIGIGLFCMIFFFNKKIDKYKESAIVVFIWFITFYKLLLNPFHRIMYLNVGQADTSIILKPFSNKVIMIDTGSKYSLRNIESYLNAMGIREIEYLIITHMDKDHSENMDILQKMYIVGEVINSKSMIKEIDSFDFYLKDTLYEDENDDSIIMDYKVYDHHFLFLGDISSNVEREFLKEFNEKVDLLKLAHHGSNTSSSYQLLETLRPKIALISAGINNMYNHPSSEVVKRLHQYKISYYTSMDSGDILVMIFKNLYFIITSNHEFVIMI